jgi:hypothetical protein
MIPAIDHPIWVKIVTGKVPVQSSKLAINLLIQNNKMDYEKDPSPARLKQLVARTHQFFCQYELAFSAEFAKILR